MPMSSDELELIQLRCNATKLEFDHTFLLEQEAKGNFSVGFGSDDIERMIKQNKLRIALCLERIKLLI
jgi:hypothetical protein